jgi:hypothetical protein
MSFRAKREILWEQAIEKIGFLPTVEMTNTSFSSFYELITFALSASQLYSLSPLSFELSASSFPASQLPSFLALQPFTFHL